MAAVAAAVWLGGKNNSAVKTVVVLNNAAVAEDSFTGLREGLARLGWRENETVRYIYSGIEPSLPRLRAQAHDIIGRGADLVVTMTTPTALAVRDEAEAAGLPLLLMPSSNPVATGLVGSLAHPGQNITGIAFALQEPRRLEWLLRLAPGITTVWIPYDFSDLSPATSMIQLRQAAATLGVTLLTTDIRSSTELHAALKTIPVAAQSIFIPADSLLASATDDILAAAWKRGLPVTTPHRGGVSQGALFSYGFDLNAVGNQAARLADQILSGIPASDLPIETADISLTINLASADRLGLVIPDEVLRHAVVLGRPGR